MRARHIRPCCSACAVRPHLAEHLWNDSEKKGAFIGSMALADETLLTRRKRIGVQVNGKNAERSLSLTASEDKRS